MKIISAKFVRGISGEDKIFDNNIPQIAFIGRSNVGKSSTINSLVGQKNLAKASSTPGRTQEINVFMINDRLYLVDLPGYGFAKLSKQDRQWLQELINWYFFSPKHQQRRVALIIDAEIGPTVDDLEMIQALDEHRKEVVIVANKVDKIKKSEYKRQLESIKAKVGSHQVFPYSAKTGAGGKELSEALFDI